MTEFPNIQVQMVFQSLGSAKIFTLSKTYFYDYTAFSKRAQGTLLLFSTFLFCLHTGSAQFLISPLYCLPTD